MDDTWGSATINDVRNPVNYMRTDPTPFGNEDMLVYEPCNYVSNVSYYHLVTEVCEYDW